MIPPPPPQNKRKRGGPVEFAASTPEELGTPTPEVEAEREIVVPLEAAAEVLVASAAGSESPTTTAATGTEAGPETADNSPNPPQLSMSEALALATSPISFEEQVEINNHPGTSEPLYCPDCYLPLHPDPNPEKLYIFLHALRYTTSLGTFETEMPEWAAEGWEWER